MLLSSNIFVTLPWYIHLKFKCASIFLFFAILLSLSYGLAFVEYSFQVEANIKSSSFFSITQLKILQEYITLVLFTAIVWILFNETP